MEDLQPYVMIAFGFISCGALAWLIKIGRSCMHAVHEVPRITLYHAEAMAAIEDLDSKVDEIKAEVVATNARQDAQDGSLRKICQTLKDKVV